MRRFPFRSGVYWATQAKPFFRSDFESEALSGDGHAAVEHDRETGRWRIIGAQDPEVGTPGKVPPDTSRHRVREPRTGRHASRLLERGHADGKPSSRAPSGSTPVAPWSHHEGADDHPPRGEPPSPQPVLVYASLPQLSSECEGVGPAVLGSDGQCPAEHAPNTPTKETSRDS